MGNDEILIDVLEQGGHFYVQKSRYIHLHVYTADFNLARMLTNKLPHARVAPLNGTFDVFVSSRVGLQEAVEVLKKLRLSDKWKPMLMLAEKYCVCPHRDERESLAAQLKTELDRLRRISQGAPTDKGLGGQDEQQDGNGGLK